PMVRRTSLKHFRWLTRKSPVREWISRPHTITRLYQRSLAPNDFLEVASLQVLHLKSPMQATSNDGTSNKNQQNRSGRFFRWEIYCLPLRKAFTLPATRETGILLQHLFFAAAI